MCLYTLFDVPRNLFSLLQKQKLISTRQQCTYSEWSTFGACSSLWFEKIYLKSRHLSCTNSLPRCPQYAVLHQAEGRSRGLHPVSRRIGMAPKIRTIFCCFLRHICRKLDCGWKWSSKDSSQFEITRFSVIASYYLTCCATTLFSWWVLAYTCFCINNQLKQHKERFNHCWLPSCKSTFSCLV